MNNADLIVRILKAAGITHGFGVPSGNVLPLIEAMRAGGIEFVLTAHEGSAAFAADVSARMTGIPGLALATLGPGATNLTTGVGNAFLDRSPMIAITCNLHRPQLGRRLQMWIDHHQLFKPITKASFALAPGSIAQTLRAALEIALTEPQGPVHLDLPEDVALAASSEALPEPAVPREVRAPDEASIARVAARLRESRRPIVVLGANAMRMKQPGLLRTAIEHHRLPFATTTMAKGLIDESHLLSVGCLERARRKLQRSFLRGADLIVGIGYDTAEVEYEAWIGEVPLVHIDIEHADVDRTVRVADELVGDLDAALAAINRMPALSHTWEAQGIKAHRDAFQASLRPATPNFAPHQAIDVVRRVLPRNGVLAFDVGAHTHQIASQWAAHEPRTFLITNCWSSMGFGLPAAIAAKIARPDLPVVCVIGDGCFQMTCGELAVARRLGLAIPFVVLDDRWLSLIKVKQERRNFELYGTQTIPGGYETPPAHYFGVPAVGVRSADALERELRQALHASGPIVIEAVVDAAHYSETVFD